MNKRYFIRAIKKRIVLTLISMMICAKITPSYSQGGWNIKYILPGSLSPELVGKEIRIDFRAKITDSLKGEVTAFNVRNLLSQEDTISLVIGGKLTRAKESWKLYPDAGSLGDQVLEIVGGSGNERTYIKEIYLVSIDESILTLDAMVYTSAGKNKEVIFVNKLDIKGILLQM